MVLFRAVIALSLFAAPAIAAEIPESGIISEPGQYTLATDLISTGRIGIEITASGVGLDLSDNAVRCEDDDPAAVNYGIKISGGDVTVRNGTITGCFMGSHASDSDSASFIDIDYSGNTYIGAHGGSVFRGNTFADISGYVGEGYAIGINAPSADCVIVGNDFRNLYRQPSAPEGLAGEGVAVLLSQTSTDCTISRNWVENDELHDDPDIGFWISATGASVTENVFTNIGRAVAAYVPVDVKDNRFWMKGPQALSYAIGADDGMASGNVIIGYATAFDGDIPNTGNLILP